MIDSTSLIENITSALLYLYPSDKWAPGITIAKLNNDKYYVSIVRYNPNKNILFKTSDFILEIALLEAAEFIVEQQTETITPLNKLAKFINELDGSEFNTLNCFDKIKSKRTSSLRDELGRAYWDEKDYI